MTLMRRPTRRLSGSARWKARTFGANSPPTMWMNDTTVNPMT